MLGAIGALLYRLVNELNDEISELESEFAYNIGILIKFLNGHHQD
tara:strand:- start:3283 stop:3417 length:135 start_codon:yes stop_codon:yes gene_type:complete